MWICINWERVFASIALNTKYAIYYFEDKNHLFTFKTNRFACYLYDAVTLYANALHESIMEARAINLTDEEAIDNGQQIISKILGRKYKSLWIRLRLIKEQRHIYVQVCKALTCELTRMGMPRGITHFWHYNRLNQWWTRVIPTIIHCTRRWQSVPILWPSKIPPIYLNCVSNGPFDGRPGDHHAMSQNAVLMGENAVKMTTTHGGAPLCCSLLPPWSSFLELPPLSHIG